MFEAGGSQWSFRVRYTALNPMISIGSQLMETLRKHRDVSRPEGLAIITDLLARLDISEPARVLQSRPHETSGGMNQRMMLAMALLGEPQVLIADEPTTMLDAIAQRDFFELLMKVERDTNMALWLITHDFGVVALMADRVVVMYAGSPVEWADAKVMLNEPKHPYTRGLIGSVPDLHRRTERLSQISGEPPTPFALPTGCRFAPRCPRAMQICHKENPPVFAIDDGSMVRCWLYAATEAGA